MQTINYISNEHLLLRDSRFHDLPAMQTARDGHVLCSAGIYLLWHPVYHKSSSSIQTKKN